MPNPGYDSGLGSADAVLALLAAGRGWVDAERVDGLAEELRARRAAGRATSLLAHLLDQGLLDQAQAEELKQLRAALGRACACGHVTYRAPGTREVPPCERCTHAPTASFRREAQPARVNPILAWGCGLMIAGLFLVPSLAFVIGHAWLTREVEPEPFLPEPPLAAAVPAADPGSPFLWVVERDPPAYLYGTIHIADPRLATLPPLVEEAFGRSARVWTEVPLDRGSVALRRGLAELPAGETIDQVLPPDLQRGVERAFARRGLKDVPAPCARLQPWALAHLIPQLDESRQEKLVLDQMLWNRAEAAGKRPRGLETVEEQVAALEEIDGEELLRLTLAEDEAAAREGRSQHEPLLAAWLAGGEAVFQLEDQRRAGPPGYRKKLVTERSQRLAGRIDAALGSEEEAQMSAFFAVGVGHCLGSSGILALLRREGHVIRRLGPADAGRLGRR